MTQVISFINLQEGGGKTTTVLNLATALKRRGHHVLVVDLDSDETMTHRIRLPNPGRTTRVEQPAKIILTCEGWHLMRAAVSVPLLRERLKNRSISGEHAMPLRSWVVPGEDELPSLFEVYDYVLVDCSTPEMAPIMEALALSDEVIVPLDSESLQFYDAVDRIGELFSERSALNPRLRFAGVFMARYSPRFRRARDMLTRLFDVFGPVNCFSAYLPDSDTVRQAEARKASVITDAPTSQAAHAFYQLAEQLTQEAPRNSMPVLLMMPGRMGLDPNPMPEAPLWGTQNQPVPEFVAAPMPTWRERAMSATETTQAVRYAVLWLLEQPSSPEALEVFETRLVERIDTARYSDLERLVELGEFVAEHSLDHYAAQVFRRATELNPAHVRAWADLARVTQVEAERAYAWDQCLGLDQGLAAAEAPVPARKHGGLVPGFASLQTAGV